jgi:hypothetical protein
VIAVPDITQIDTALLGLAITIDKPIILVCKPGCKVPEKLAKVVDRTVEISQDAKPEEIILALKAALIDLGIDVDPCTGPVRPRYDIEPSQN